MIPSKTINTLSLPDNVFLPRTCILGEEPAEVTCPTFNPGTVPCNDCNIFVFGDFSKSLIFALTTAPVKSDFLMEP